MECGRIGWLGDMVGGVGTQRMWCRRSEKINGSGFGKALVPSMLGIGCRVNTG